MAQYIPKSALVAKIEELKKSHDNWSCMGKCFHQEYENLLSFIDTLEVKWVQEEPASEDLLKASIEFAKGFGEWHYAMPCFKAGSEWKEHQMMKEAVSATIVSDLDPHGADYGNQKIICGWGELEAKKFKNGSKVKLIIIKED